MKIFMHAIPRSARHSLQVVISEVHSPFERNFSVHLGNWRPDVEKMQEAAEYLIGTHDFTSVCSIKTATSNKVRTVNLLTLEEQGDLLDHDN